MAERRASENRKDELREQRRELGVSQPERPRPDDPAGDTPDQDGIEIDNAIERPQDGQPGQPGAKVY